MSEFYRAASAHDTVWRKEFLQVVRVHKKRVSYHRISTLSRAPVHHSQVCSRAEHDAPCCITNDRVPLTTTARHVHLLPPKLNFAFSTLFNPKHEDTGSGHECRRAPRRKQYSLPPLYCTAPTSHVSNSDGSCRLVVKSGHFRKWFNKFHVFGGLRAPRTEINGRCNLSRGEILM
ncbi:unnamed protein product, partial [Scytosiphon promiscuus]